MYNYHEPWYRSRIGEYCIRDSHDILVSNFLEIDIGDRIVTCVNALAGITNEDIEKIMNRGLSFSKLLVGSQGLINELLDALEPFALVGINPDPTNPPAECYLKAYIEL